jgi:hypothetical protein
MWALAVQNHGAFGLAKPTLYSTRGHLVRHHQGRPNAHPGVVQGYDDVTGVGSPNGTAWLKAVSAP